MDSASLRDQSLADEPAVATISPPKILADGYRRLERIEVSLQEADCAPIKFQRDILRAGRVVGVLPIDPIRQEIVLIRQFRLSGHLALDKGDMIEIVAGRIEANEGIAEAAHRECFEEIGVAPSRLVELFQFMTTPGLTDEKIHVFLGIVDASKVVERAGVAAEAEHILPMRVDIGRAVSALEAHTIHNGLTLVALQWLALNRERLSTY